jgi:hypothetical protein
MPNNASYDYFRMQAPALAPLAVSFSVIAPLAACGCLLGGLRGTRRMLLALHVASGLATLAVFYNLARLRLPVAVAAIPIAAFGLVRLVRLARSGRWPVLAVALVTTGLVAALVLRPLPARVSRVRLSDYGVPNEIAMHLIRLRTEAGDSAGALRLARRQLDLEPADLHAADPDAGVTRLSALSATLAGSFAPLHGAAAELLQRAGRPDEARDERRRFAITTTIAAGYARASGRSDGGP